MNTDTISKEVQSYWKHRRLSGDAAERFDKVAKSCNFQEPWKDPFDGEHINKCKNPEHHHASWDLTECECEDCPMHLVEGD